MNRRGFLGWLVGSLIGQAVGSYLFRRERKVIVEIDGRRIFDVFDRNGNLTGRYCVFEQKHFDPQIGRARVAQQHTFNSPVEALKWIRGNT